MSATRSTDVSKYETFIYDKLQKDLEEDLKSHEKIVQEIQEYENLATFIQKKREIPTPRTKSLNNLSKDVFAHAIIDSKTKVIVKLQEGIFAALQDDRALKFIEEKLKVLKKREQTRKQYLFTKSNIDLILINLNQMNYV